MRMLFKFLNYLNLFLGRLERSRPVRWLFARPLWLRLSVPFLISMIIVWWIALTWSRRSSAAMDEVGRRMYRSLADGMVDNLTSMLSNMSKINRDNSNVLEKLNARKERVEVILRFREQLLFFEHLTFVGVGYDNGDYIAVDRLGPRGALRVALRLSTIDSELMSIYNLTDYLKNPVNAEPIEQHPGYDVSERPWFKKVSGPDSPVQEWIGPYSLATQAHEQAFSHSQRIPGSGVVVTTMVLESFRPPQRRANDEQKRLLAGAQAALYVYNRDLKSYELVVRENEGESVNQEHAGEWDETIAKYLNSVQNRLAGDTKDSSSLTLRTKEDVVMVTIARLNEFTRTRNVGAKNPIPPTILVVAASQKKLIGPMQSELVKWLEVELAAVTVILLITAVFSYWRVSRPLAILTKYASDFSVSDPKRTFDRKTQRRIAPFTEWQDEVGKLASALLRTTRTLDFLFSVAKSSNEADLCSEVLEQCAARAARFLKFKTGKAYSIKSSSLYEADTKRHPKVREALEEAVWSREPLTVEYELTDRTSTDKKFLMILPLLSGVDRDVVGILELEAAQPVLVDQEMQTTLEQVLKQLARVAARDQNDRQKDDFPQQLGHDFKDPIVSIELRTRRLARAQLAEPLGTFARDAYQSVVRVRESFEQLHVFARLEARSGVESPQACELRAMLERLLFESNDRARSKNLKLVLIIDPDIPNRVLLDAFCVQTIIGNLLRNAVKFTETGEVVVRIVRQMESRHDLRLGIRVADSGPGIEDCDKARIFEAFVQLNSKRDGIGLGLYLVAKYVERLRGRIDVSRSALGGAAFDVSLPLNLPPDEPPHRTVPASMCFPDRTVLSLVKHKPTFEVVVNACQSWRMPLTLLDEITPESALAALSNGGIDFVLMDDPLIAKALQIALADLNLPGTPHLMLLGDTSPAELTYLQFLPTPILESTMHAAIKSALNTSDQTAIGDQWRVLVVDDDPLSTEEVDSLLDQSLFQVTHAHSLKDALQIIASNQFDLLITDLQLEVSNEDGLILARSLRKIEEPDGQMTPIIFLTAHPPTLELRPDLPDRIEIVCKPLGASLDLLNRALCNWGLTDRIFSPSTISTRPEDPNPIFDQLILGSDQTRARRLARIRYQQLFETPAQTLHSSMKHGEQDPEFIHDILGWLQSAGAVRASIVTRNVYENMLAGQDIRLDQLQQLESELATFRPHLEEYLRNERSDR